MADAEVIACGWRHPASARRRRATSCWSSTRWATRRAGTPTARRWSLFLRAPGDAVAGQPAPAGAQSAAHPRLQGRGRPRASSPARRPFAGYLTEAAASFFAGVQDGSGPARRAVPREPAPGARPRLLRPHRLRVRHHRARRAGHGDGRRALRRAGERDGRPATPGVGWAAGIERLAMLLAEPPPPPRAGRGGADRRRRPKRAALALAQDAARTPASRVEMAYRGNLRPADGAGRPHRRARRGDRSATTSWRAAWRRCAISTAASRRRWRSTRWRIGSAG